MNLDSIRFEEEKCIEGELSKEIKILLDKFSIVNRVLENAAFTAALMNYMFHHSSEFFSLLFYFTIKKYKRINESKNAMRNYNHVNMEIFTVFVHPQAILPISYKNTELFDQIESNISSPDCIIYYRRLSKFVVSNVLSNYLEEFKTYIESGQEIYSFTNHLQEEIFKIDELMILYALHKSINNSLIRSQKSRCLPLQKQDIKNTQISSDFQIAAIAKAMNTQFEHYLYSKRYSFTISHPDTAIPVDTFLNQSRMKLPNKQRIKGHCFESGSLPTVSFCIVCDLIIWGSYPNCLFCRNCQKPIHIECKDIVKICQIDAKRTKKTEVNKSENETEKKTTGQIMLDKMTKDLTKIVHQRFRDNDLTGTKESEERVMSRPNLLRKPSKLNPGQCRKMDSILFQKEITQKYNVKYANSMNLNKKTQGSDLDTLSRSKSARSPSNECYFGDSLIGLKMKFSSEDSGIATSVEPLPTSQFETDDEMQVLETFKAEIELKKFSNNFNSPGIKFEANCDRRFVLMEFHYSIKFIRMTLKRFKYMLVEPWKRINEHYDLFELVSLDCIDKLYILIGSLADLISSCVTECSYDSTMATKVLEWLSTDDDANFRSWLNLSTNLCCTNILQSVKMTCNEHKQIYPKLNELFSLEINRLLIMDQLSNMRPLLFNLPMIVNKIWKDLKKYSFFKDESNIWKEVHLKLSRLPKLIDERCMPVVQLINNGIILSSSLKYKQNIKGVTFYQEMKNYIDYFPSTIFKNVFVDFQFVKISNLSQNISSNSNVFVKEATNAAVICYEREMILLQSDNDKFVLKHFKGTGACKLFPVIQFDNVHVTKQINKDNKEFRHQLSVLVINQAILAQILFKDQSVRDMWCDVITKAASIMKMPQSAKENVIACECPPGNVCDDPVKCETSNNDKEIIQERLNQSVNQVLTTFKLISNELSTNFVPDRALTSNSEIDQVLPSAFLCCYIDILKEYTSVAETMIKHSRFNKSSFLLESCDVTSHIPRIKDISNQMDNLLQAFEANVESESSGESSLEDDITDDPKKTESQSIESYIEDVIAEALNKIQFNSKSDKDSK